MESPGGGSLLGKRRGRDSPELPFTDESEADLDTEAAAASAANWACGVVMRGRDAVVGALEDMCDAWSVDRYMACGSELDAFGLVRLFFGSTLALAPSDRMEGVGARVAAWLMALSGLAFYFAEFSSPDDPLVLRVAALTTLIGNVGLAAQVQAVVSRGHDLPEIPATDRDSASVRLFNARMGSTRVLDPSNMNSTEKYIRSLFAKARYRGYGLGRGNEVLRQVFVSGLATHAWEAVMTAEDEPLTVEAMINQFSQSDIDGGGAESSNSLMMCSYLSNNKAAVMELCKGLDWRLPRLVKARGVFSFRDAVYVAHLGPHRDLILPLGDERIAQLLGRRVAAKFFDLPLLDVAREDWRDIPTPAMDHIMTHQNWKPEVQDVLWTLIGRMLYDVGTDDRWACFPYLLGLAGTGKSLIVEHVVGQLYSSEQKGTITSNTEVRFGLGALLDKFIVTGPELSSGLGFDQMEIQSMASGESIKVNIKNKTGRDVTWRSPLFLAGNSLPEWSDNNGSLLRRLIPLPFTVSVTEEDKALHPDMEASLKREMAANLLKASRAYRARLESDGPNALRLPESVTQTGRDVVGSTSSLMQLFADEERIRRGKDERCRWSDLRAALQAYERTNKIPAGQCVSGRMTNAFFIGLFLKQVGCQRTGHEVVGCRLLEEGWGAEAALA